MKYKINNNWFLRRLKIRYFRIPIILFIITAFLTINSPVAANFRLKSQTEKTQYIASLEQGKQLYEA